MKKMLFLTSLMILGVIVTSQTPVDTFPLYKQYGLHPNYRQLFTDMDMWSASHPSDTLINLEQFERDRYFMEPRLDQNGSMQGYDATMTDFFLNGSTACNESFIESNWYCIGPDRSPAQQYLGQLHAVWIDPDDEAHILVGSEGGGIWETHTGTNSLPEWICITDDEGFPGIHPWRFAVNPENKDEIYVATYLHSGFFDRDYGLGIIYSEDGGVNWQVDENFNEFVEVNAGTILSDIPTSMPWTYAIKYLPNSSGGFDLYLPFFNYMLKKNFASGSWEPLTSLTMGVDAMFQDILTVPGNPDYLFTTATWVSSFANIQYSTDGGDTWTLLDYNYSAPNNILISVPNGNILYVMYEYPDPSDTKNHFHHLKIYEISGTTPVLIDEFDTNLDPSGCYYCQRYIIQMYASPTNDQILYCSDKQGVLLKSTDGGHTFSEVSDYSATTNHTDIRDFVFYKPTTGLTGDNPGNVLTGDHDILFIAEDGGLSKSVVGGTTWSDLNGTGLNINNAMGLGCTELDKNRILVTANDGNGFIRQSTGWTSGPGGDTGESDISNTDPDKGITEITNSTRSFKGVNMAGGTPVTPTVPNFPGSGVNPVRKILRYHELTDDLWTGTTDMYRIVNTFTPTDDWHNTSDSWTGSLTQLNPKLKITQAITAMEFVPNPSLPSEEFKYFAVAWMPGYPADINDENDHKIIRFDPTQLTDLQWANITPYLDEDVYPFDDGSYLSGFNEGWAFDIAADPSNPREIWVGFTIFDYDNTDQWRVMYSPDAGDTWYNRSEGLPKFPVNTLKYWKGSDDIVFAGTDVGVYVFHKTPGTTTGEGTWECFNNGLPNVFVTDMEINYCTQSLRISTYGHSLWETSLPNIYATSTPITINTDVTWSQNVDTYTDVYVNAGATLTIKDCEVRFPKDGSLVVQPGGKLIVDGATLTNRCDFWAGIVVRGNPTELHPAIEDIYTGTYPVDGDDQGVVYLKNTAVIENAKVGISTVAGYFLQGGIVIANGTQFINNETSVNLNPFDTGTPDADDDNISEFYNCDFIVNVDYFGEEFDHHVALHDVDGVDFLGCRFTDMRSGAPINQSEGITSLDATYTVKNVPCPPGGGGCPEPLPIESSFSNLFRGVEASNSHYLPLNIEINGVNFSKNRRGILLSGIENSLIISNRFEIPDHPTSNSYGLYLESCMNYQVENNYFTNYGLIMAGAPFKTGIYVANNSTASTEIYRNTFENLEAGIICQGDNSHLQIKCNTFLSDILQYDILVTSGELANQGRCLGGGWPTVLRSRAPAGNVFSHDCHNSEGDFRAVVTSPAIPSFEYRHHIGTPYYPANACYTSSIITLKPCTGISFDQGGYESCPSTLPEEVGGGSGSMMMTMAGETQSSIETEQAKIDNGSTARLISTIENSTSESALYDSLMLAGSYVSDSVLEKLIETPFVLTDENLVDVLSTNSPIKENLGDAIQESSYEVSGSTLDNLTSTEEIDGNGNLISLESDMSILLEDIDALQQIKNSYLDEAITYYLAEDNVDSAFVALISYDSNLLAKKESEISLIVRNFEQAQQSILEVPENSDEDVDFKNLYSLLTNVYSEGRTLLELTEEEQATLREFGNKYTPSGVKALNILKYSLGEPHEELFDEINEYFLKEGQQLEEFSSYGFTLYPNPASDIVFIDYRNIQASSNILLNIYNINGNKIKSIALDQYESYLSLNVKDLEAGIFIFEMIVGGEIGGIQKLVKE